MRITHDHVSIFVVAALLGWTLHAPAADDEEVLRVRRLEVVDASGRVCAMLVAQEGEGSLLLGGDPKGFQALLTAGQDEAGLALGAILEGAASGLLVGGPEGDAVLTLRTAGGFPALRAIASDRPAADSKAPGLPGLEVLPLLDLRAVGRHSSLELRDSEGHLKASLPSEGD